MKFLKDKAATGLIPKIQQVTEAFASALPRGIKNYNVGELDAGVTAAILSFDAATALSDLVVLADKTGSSDVAQHARFLGALQPCMNAAIDLHDKPVAPKPTL